METNKIEHLNSISIALCVCNKKNKKKREREIFRKICIFLSINYMFIVYRKYGFLNI